MSFLGWLFDVESFVPRWRCGPFPQALGWAHIGADVAIFGAYLAIPCVITWFVSRRRDLAHLPVFRLFAAFILFCGLSHLIEASIFWQPWYRLSAVVKVITALVSWATVAALVPLVPRALSLQEENEGLERRVRERTEELRRANAQLEQAQRALADIAAQLAMPSAPPRPGPYRLTTFSLADMIALGAAIRHLRRDCPGAGSFTQALVRLLYQRVVDDEGRPAFALARLFKLLPFAELDDQQRAAASASLPGISPDTRCLALMGTAGDQPEWNSPGRSAGHRAIPLPSPEAAERLPMVASLVRSLGFEAGQLLRPDEGLLPCSPAGAFFVPEARGSPFVPAQDFVERFGIQSVVGFGGLNPEGRLFAVVLFSRVPIPPDTAGLFGHLSLSTQIALLSYHNSPGRTEAQITTLDRLLRNYEEVAADQERKLVEAVQALRRSNRELEEFAYVASHDLQEPLRKVQVFGDLLASGHGEALGDEGRDYLRRMQNAGSRMQALINDLLAYSRVTTKGRPLAPVCLAEVARQVASDLEGRLRQTGGAVELGELPAVQGDATQLAQLLQNLVGNALKYHKKGVPPAVRVWAEPGPEEGTVRLLVADNGIGFDEKYLGRIFAPFQRLHGRGEYEGTGMGLAISRRIAERHGGGITATSAPGQGSTFVVTLQAAQAAPEANDE